MARQSAGVDRLWGDYNARLRWRVRVGEILQLLAEKPGISRKLIQETLGLSENESKGDLARLRSLGLIHQEGKGRGTVLYLAEG